MIIGIGHKARSGKDSVANYLVDRYGFTKIGFADTLYGECRNCRIVYDYNWNRFAFGIPNDEYYYFGNDVENYILKWIKNSGKNIRTGMYEYNGMTEKDPTLLQWWGTDFRRKQDEDYWVKIIRKKINIILMKDNSIRQLEAKRTYRYFEPDILNIVIPDVRFKNEAQMIKDFGGEVWKVERYNTEIIFDRRRIGIDLGLVNKKILYIDPSRDSNHPSETDLDNYKFDRVLSAESGNLNSLYKQTNKIMGRN